MGSLIRAFIMAGTAAAALTLIVLCAFSAAEGLAWWMPLNATSHVIHGARAANIVTTDWVHTGSGTFFNIASCYFWAVIAVLLFYVFRRILHLEAVAASWIAGLGAAVTAGFVDYGLIPEKFTPGWELVLNWQAVMGSLLAMGVGLSLGLHAAFRKSG